MSCCSSSKHRPPRRNQKPCPSGPVRPVRSVRSVRPSVRSVRPSVRPSVRSVPDFLGFLEIRDFPGFSGKSRISRVSHGKSWFFLDFLEDLAKFCEENPIEYPVRYYGEAGVPPWNYGKEGSMTGYGTKKCVYKGEEYNSLTEAAEANGVSVSAVSQYIKRNPTDRGRYEGPIVYKGREYANLRECARITGNPYSSVQNWVLRHND